MSEQGSLVLHSRAGAAEREVPAGSSTREWTVSGQTALAWGRLGLAARPLPSGLPSSCASSKRDRFIWCFAVCTRPSRVPRLKRGRHQRFPGNLPPGHSSGPCVPAHSKPLGAELLRGASCAASRTLSCPWKEREGKRGDPSLRRGASSRGSAWTLTWGGKAYAIPFSS